MKKLIGALIGLLLAAGLASAQGLLPNGQQQFVDSAGVPLAGGWVWLYSPGTTQAKTSWSDPGLTVPNTNPVQLDSAGRATIWGTGSYREVLQDSDGNTVWDAVTSIPTASSSSTADFGLPYSISAGATTNLALASSHNILLTGTGSISSFGSAASTSSPVYLVQWQSTGGQLVYNSSLMQLPGNASITASAGDSFMAVYLGNGAWRVMGYASGATAGSVPKLHRQVFSSSGTFTFPSSTTTQTVFRIVAVGGGGGGSGSALISSSYRGPGGGGAAGGAGEGYFYGFSASDTLSISIGSAGSGGTGAATPTEATDGTSTTVTYGSTAIATATYGCAAADRTSGTTSYSECVTSRGGGAGREWGGKAGTATFAADDDAVLTLVSSEPLTAMPGGSTTVNAASSTDAPYQMDQPGGLGGASVYGTGGQGGLGGNSGTGDAIASAGQDAAGYGAGGGGAGGGTGYSNGGDGAAGYVIVEWVQ